MPFWSSGRVSPSRWPARATRPPPDQFDPRPLLRRPRGRPFAGGRPAGREPGIRGLGFDLRSQRGLERLHAGLPKPCLSDVDRHARAGGALLARGALQVTGPAATELQPTGDQSRPRRRRVRLGRNQGLASRSQGSLSASRRHSTRKRQHDGAHARLGKPLGRRRRGRPKRRDRLALGVGRAAARPRRDGPAARRRHHPHELGP